ncbi:MAG: glycine cleavage system protein H [Candidatus Kryptonium sp.]
MLDKKLKDIHEITALEVTSRFVENLEKINFPKDRLYTKSHTWIKSELEFVTIGISASIVYLFTPITEFIFLQVPSFVSKGTPCAWIMHRDGILTIRSPFRGELFEINEALLKHPNLVNQDPYSAGWLFKIKAVETITGFMSQSEFLELYHNRIELLKKELLLNLDESIKPVSVPTLQDGGRVIETVKELLGTKRYFSVVSKIFGLP